MQILFVVPYPVGVSPSQRFRFEQYFDALASRGHVLKICTFVDIAVWAILYKPGNTSLKIKGVLFGFANRLLLLLSITKYDRVFIHREATPLGPPWFEWLAAKFFRRKIIYDFDDAIWLDNTSQENRLVSKLKWHSKVGLVCRMSYSVSCGNEYLRNYASRFNTRAYLNPTTIDTYHLHNAALHIKDQLLDYVTIGWTGTHSTIKYLAPLMPIIEEIERRNPGRIRFLVIADKKPAHLNFFTHFKKWSRENEIEDLMCIDIGVMPLTNDQWALGKCGFKILQYMSLEITAVASAVGENLKIIDHGQNGFLCNKDSEWLATLENLILNAPIRKSIGKEGRKKVMSSYSIESNSDNFLSLFE